MRASCSNIRVGIIARCDNRGLGVQSYEFFRHMRPAKVLVVMFMREKNFSGRYTEEVRWPVEVRLVMDEPKDEDVRWLLSDVDVVVGFETFYNIRVPKMARRVGVKTVLRCNWEWLDDYRGEGPDLYLVPSMWCYERVPEPKKFFPVPVAREKLPWKMREKARVFVHNAGNGQAAYDRNGTEVVLEAIPLVKDQDVRFIIKTQGYGVRDIGDSRVEYVDEDVEEYGDAWPEGDVLVYPRRYGGLSLMLNEAMSLGMVPIMTDMEPQRSMLLGELLVKVDCVEKMEINNSFEYARGVSPEEVAKKIDWIAGEDLRGFSVGVGCIAEDISWKGLQVEYSKVLNEVVRGEV